MIRALSTAVTGLRSHQIKMDAIGNNIANVNTTAFKNTQVRFEDLYYQTMKGATATLIRGGQNPLQAGMGVQTMATIVNHLQGNLKSTDRESDLAIEGHGFFILNNGVQNSYTRDGSFGRDGQGYLVNPNGMRVMGWMGDPVDMESSHQLETIHIPLGEQMIANATSDISFAGNLDAKAEVGDSYVTEHYLYDSLGRRYDVEYTFTKLEGNVWEYEVAVFEHMHNNKDFLVVPKSNRVSLEFSNPGVPNQPLNLNFSGPAQVMLPNVGFLVSSHDNNVTMQFNNIGNNAELDVAVNGNDIVVTLETDGLGVVTSTYADIYAAIKEHGEANSLINIHIAGYENELANVSALDLPDPNPIEEVDGNVDFWVSASLDDVTLQFVDGGPGEALDVSVNGTDITVRLADGGSTYGDVRNALERSPANLFINSIDIGNELDLAAAGLQTDLPNPDYSTITVNLQTNEDGEVISTYREIRDLIEEDDVASAFFRIRHSTDPSVRNRIATAGSFDYTTIPNSNIPHVGELHFDNHGNILTSISDIQNVYYNPTDAAQLNVGLDYERITQLASNYSIIVRAQDGYASGELYDYHVSMDGMISGVYTNGVSDTLGRLALAGFTNPEGLHRVGGNLFQVSANSGDPRIGYAGEGGRGTVRSSSLEMSNVDLSQEFTELITASRGFQANTRLVTTSDEILVEVLNMKR